MIHRFLCWLGLHDWRFTGRSFRVGETLLTRDACAWCGRQREREVPPE